MSGTVTGGKKAAATNKRVYGDDFYARIGAMGGKLGRTGGFYANRELASIAGRKGGIKSRRGPQTLEQRQAQARRRAHAEFQEGFSKV
jgi:general stress protein YciG